MDEFPYMVESNRSLPSILQKIWDHYFKDLNVMLIIYSSSMSFMEKEILSEKNPLYGRTTGIEKTKLPYYLGGLIDLGIVRKEYPSTIKVKEQAKRRSGIYKIDNSYFRAVHRFNWLSFAIGCIIDDIS